MARPGVTAEQIIEVIQQIEAQGQEATVTTVRERLGTGSYSTIGAVLSDWRRKKAVEARPLVPEAPEGLRHLFAQLWSEAWSAATAVHEPERQASTRERQEYERTRGEMLAEIARLEGELDGEKQQAARTIAALAAERDGCRADLQTTRAALAAAEGALGEARKQVEHEKERNDTLSERVIAEAARAQALAARLDELQTKGK